MEMTANTKCGRGKSRNRNGLNKNNLIKYHHHNIQNNSHILSACLKLLR